MSRWGILALMGCYAPTPSPGAACPDGRCPAGLVCAAATRTCELADVDASSFHPSDASIGDVPPNVATDGASPDALGCYGGGLLQICPTSGVGSPLQITSDTTIDTDTSGQCVTYTGTAPSSCVIAGTSVSVAATRILRAVGTRPLVILATGSIIVDGTIDVAVGGANTNPSACVAPTAATSPEGGAGGSFTGAGGTGGGKVIGLGPAGSPATPTPALRGGCPGGAGAGNNPGMPGAGGGAVYLIAAGSISITGTIDASGGGGGGASSGNESGGGGGGGGGAGGFIGLDAPTVTIGSAGRLFANGGGGGEGATPHQDGTNGGTSSAPASPAKGGADGAPHGGDGGNGAAGATRGGDNGSPGGPCGHGPDGGSSGGGGGGGAGMIYVFPAQALGGTVSPPPS